MTERQIYIAILVVSGSLIAAILLYSRVHFEFVAVQLAIGAVLAAAFILSCFSLLGVRKVQGRERAQMVQSAALAAVVLAHLFSMNVADSRQVMGLIEIAVGVALVIWLISRWRTAPMSGTTRFLSITTVVLSLSTGANDVAQAGALGPLNTWFGG